jgi:Family of unknown function (DUF6886)
MAIGLVRPAAGELLHFSEDPSITVFTPHVASTAQDTQPYVWAVDYDQAPSYWFPRDCPRVLTWVSSGTTTHDRERFLGAASRVHAIEYAWLDKVVSTVLYAYRFDRSQFMLYGSPEPHAYVSPATVHPLGPPERVGCLLEAHASAGIELRLLRNLWPYWSEVIRSTVGFSGIRLRNTQPEEVAEAALPGHSISS